MITHVNSACNTYRSSSKNFDFKNNADKCYLSTGLSAMGSTETAEQATTGGTNISEQQAAATSGSTKTAGQELAHKSCAVALVATMTAVVIMVVGVLFTG